MKKIALTITLSFLLNSLFAQDTIRIDLNDNQSIYGAVDSRIQDEVAIMEKHLSIDSLTSIRINSNLYTLNQRFFEHIRNRNYKIERILLEQYVVIKEEKRRFLKLFLSDKDYKKYLKLEAKAAKIDRKRYKKNPTSDPSLIELREKAAGWDLLGHIFIFKG